MTKKAHVYVIDNDKEILASLSCIIKSIGYESELFNSAQEFLDSYYPTMQGCILLDVRMPGMSGTELQIKLNELKTKGNSIPPIIFISAYTDVFTAVQAMKAGAFDYLTKPVNAHLLMETINKAIRLDQENRDSDKAFLEAHIKYSSLTPRETEVMQGVLSGKVNKMISTELNISSKTVELHRASLMKKMGAESVSELVKLMYSNDVLGTLQGMIFLFNTIALTSDQT